jgi:hypothetical protein
MSTTVGVRSAAINAAILQEKRAAQAHKINEIKAALASTGHNTLYHQALALGLCRSTTWNILTGGHKHGGLTADVVNTIRNCPTLPEPVRAIVNDYVRRKLAGEYGHSEKAIARFKARLLVCSSDIEKAIA